MNYEVEFEHSALLDLKEATFYEVQFTFSIDKAKARMHGLVGQVDEALSFMPARNPKSHTGSPRRCAGN